METKLLLLGIMFLSLNCYAADKTSENAMQQSCEEFSLKVDYLAELAAKKENLNATQMASYKNELETMKSMIINSGNGQQCTIMSLSLDETIKEFEKEVAK